jgi:hypothetical protein
MTRFKTVVTLTVLTALSLSLEVSAQTVQFGIFNSGATLLVKVKPSVNFTSSNQLTDMQFTIRWDSTYAIHLGSITTTYTLQKAGSELTSGPYRYQKFAFGGVPIAISWSQNVEYEVLSVPVTQTAPGTGTFSLAPCAFLAGGQGDPYIQINLNDVNVCPTSSSFYQASVSNVPLPIQLAKSSATAINDKDVEVSWHTVSETNNYGFEIERKRGQRSDVGGQNAGWAKVAFVEGHGTTLQPQDYSYVDRNLIFGKYFYRIKQIDLDGKAQLFPEMEVNVGVGPDKFVLGQNYPNPFNPSTLIDFAVPKTGRAVLKVYNILGQEVATLFDGEAEVGKVYTVSFPPARGNSFGGDTTSPASGTYFYVLRSAGKSETKRMLLLK